MNKAALILLGSALCVPASTVLAQTFPIKPIRMIVTFPPGSGADIVARLVGQKMAEDLGQQIVIDNRAGAGGSLGTDMTAKAPPDGYTIVMVSSSHTINPNVFKSLPFHPTNDFSPITMLSSTPYLLVAHPSLPVKNVAELIRLAKAKPKELNYASGGIAVGSHLAGELFKLKAKIDIVNVPYKGAPQATTDVVAGQVLLSFSTMPTALPLVKIGKLRALAVTTASRVPGMPEYPPIAETIPGFDVRTWQGLLAPAKLPDAIMARLHDSAVKALRLPDIQQKLSAQAYEAVGNSPKDFAALIVKEIAMWKEVVAAAKIDLM
jgi:tripartite-type tricarboxylate transporter receptor subunit TctC